MKTVKRHSVAKAQPKSDIWARDIWAQTFEGEIGLRPLGNALCINFLSAFLGLMTVILCLQRSYRKYYDVLIDVRISKR